MLSRMEGRILRPTTTNWVLVKEFERVYRSWKFKYSGAYSNPLDSSEYINPVDMRSKLDIWEEGMANSLCYLASH